MNRNELAKKAALSIIEWFYHVLVVEDKDYPTHEIERCMKAQHCADIEKLKEVMNRLMLDTRDKAEIIKAMEE